jgi:hypothetical protein
LEFLVFALMTHTPAVAAPPGVLALVTAVEPQAAVVDLPQLDSDLAYTVLTMERLAKSVAALPEAEREPLVAAVADLATNCPYSRASFMLILTLERELERLDPSRLGVIDHGRFELLVRGVRAHVAILRSLQGDELPMPIVGDYLRGDYLSGPHHFVDGETFAAAADPILETQRVLNQVLDLVGAMPSGTASRVDRAWKVLAGVLVHAETSDRALRQWGRAFQELAPALGRAGAEERTGRLSRLLAQHLDSRC